MTLNYGKWLYGLLGDMLRGGASAVTAGMTVSVMDSKDYNFASGKFYALMGAVFAVHAIMSLMKYIERNPLPDIITTTVAEEHGPTITVTKDESGAVTKTQAGGTKVTTTVETPIAQTPVEDKKL